MRAFFGLVQEFQGEEQKKTAKPPFPTTPEQLAQFSSSLHDHCLVPRQALKEEHAIVRNMTSLLGGGCDMAASTFIIADDHPLFRGALRQAVAGIDGTQTIIEAGDFEAARKAAPSIPMPISCCLTSPCRACPAFRPHGPARRIRQLAAVIVSATDDSVTIRRALELGASGFISKSAGIEEIRSSIQSVLEGDIATPASYQGGQETDPDVADLINRLRTLTPQQSRVLGMLGEGLLNKQIAYELGVSEATIKAHVSAILLKLKVDSRTQAVIQLGKINMAMVA